MCADRKRRQREPGDQESSVSFHSPGVLPRKQLRAVQIARLRETQHEPRLLRLEDERAEVGEPAQGRDRRAVAARERIPDRARPFLLGHRLRFDDDLPLR